MAPNLQARMGLFPYKSKEYVYAPNEHVDAQTEFGDHFPQNPTEMVTVCWSTDPALGIPVAPALVDSTQEPINLSDDTIDVQLVEVGPQTAYEVHLLGYMPRPILDGLFCALARGDAPDGPCEIVAFDAMGEDIPETRQSVDQNSKLIFFGPGIYGVRASGRVYLNDLRLIAFAPTQEYPLVRVAEVGPCLPGIGCYNDQAYLGVQLNQSDALARRLNADALARANTDAPVSSRLTSEVHRKDPRDTATLVLQQDFVTNVPPNFTAILGKPDWTYSQPVTGAPGSTFEVCPAAMWQAITLMGPVEAVTLGQAVSFPVDHFQYLATTEEIFDWIMKRSQLPFPIVRLTTFHALKGFVDTGDAQGNRSAPNVVATVQFARLIVEVQPAITAAATTAGPPAKLDGPASCDIRLFVDVLSRLDAFFVEEGPGSENFFEEQIDQLNPLNRAIKTYFPNTDESDAASLGRPYFVVGPFDLPFTKSTNKQLGVQGRDIFGRWPAEGKPDCALDPWPVQAPVFGPTRLDYPIDGRAYLSTTIMWDWALRTPRDFRLGLIVADDGKDPALASSLPAEGLLLPGEQLARPVSIVFDAGGAPSLQGTVPTGMQVIKIDPPPPDPDDPVLPAGTNDPDPRTYTLSIPIGENSEIFKTLPTRFVAVTADAWEVVSGTTEDRRSKDKGRTISRLNDPRPPILESSYWTLNWASRPNGANVARAFLKGPNVKGGAKDLLGYTAWRASESAVLDLALANEDPDIAANLIAGIRREPNMQIRLRLVQNIVGTQLSDPAFAKQFVGLFLAANTTLVDRGYEVDVPGTQPGLEFAMFTATSSSGMMSAKFDENGLTNLYAIAVPVPRKFPQPALRVITHDPDGFLALSGLCIAIVGLDQQGARRGVRFFWDANPDIRASDEILHRLDPIAELGVNDALRYIEDIEAIIDRIPFPEVRIFMLQPPQSWSPHFFSVDTVGLDAIGQDPNQDTASRRSDLVTIAMVPYTRPTLVAGKPPTKDRTWTVSPSGLFEHEVPGYADCEMMMSSLDDHKQEIDRAGPVSYGTFIGSGLKLPGSLASASYDPNQGILVTIDKNSPAKFIRLSATDPAKRGASVVLPAAW
jgi:hypothetical protein